MRVLVSSLFLSSELFGWNSLTVKLLTTILQLLPPSESTVTCSETDYAHDDNRLTVLINAMNLSNPSTPSNSYYPSSSSASSHHS